MKPFVRVGVLLVSVLTAGPALAQNWSFDARNVGMGGVGSTSNVAVDMVDEQRPYRPLVLPFGLLFQVLPNLPKLDPTSDDFDLVRTIEYSASPIHYIVGRDSTSTASAFITDLRNGTLSRDLNDVPRLLAGDEHRRRRARVAKLGPHVQDQEERRGAVSGDLCRRRTLFLDEDVGGDRSRAGRDIREPDAGVRAEHQLLHVERHAEPVRPGHHRRVPRAFCIGWRFGEDHRQRNSSAGWPVHRRQLPLSCMDSATSTSSPTRGSTPTRKASCS